MDENIKQKLIEDSFSSDYMWNAWGRVESNLASANEVIKMVSGAALKMGIILISLQFIIMMMKAYKGESGVMSELKAYWPRFLIVIALTQKSVYKTVVEYGIAKPADAIANKITLSYHDKFVEQIEKMFAAMDGSIGEWLMAVLDGSAITMVFASLAYVLSIVFAFVLPLLQSTLFLFMYYVGPICIIFSLCDATTSITKAWFSTIMTTAWMGVFGSACFLVQTNGNFFSNIVAGDNGWASVITTIVYGFISLLMFASIWPITAFIFGSSGQIGSGVTSVASAIGGAVGAATGAGAVASAGTMAIGTGEKLLGGAISKYATEGSSMAALGKNLSDFGNKHVKSGAKGVGVFQPSAARSTDTIAQGIAGDTASGLVVSDKGMTNTMNGLAKNGTVKESSDFNKIMPKQDGTYVNNALAPKLNEGKSVPDRTQLIPMKGESMDDMKSRYADSINNDKGTKGEMDRAKLSWMVKDGVSIPKNTSIRPNAGETNEEAFKRTSDNLNKAHDAQVKQEADIAKAQGSSKIPSNVEEFREKFPYQNKAFVEKALENYVDDPKAIPKHTQVVKMPGESMTDAKKRIGNLVNSKGDVLASQNKAFIANMVPEGTDIPDKIDMKQRRGENFAEAAIRTSKALGKEKK